MDSQNTSKPKDQQPGDSVDAHVRPIPAIESAYLNIGTAANDCVSARIAWADENWNDATMWISNAIAQLESAKAKIYAHQEYILSNAESSNPDLKPRSAHTEDTLTTQNPD